MQNTTMNLAQQIKQRHRQTVKQELVTEEDFLDTLVYNGFLVERSKGSWLAMRRIPTTTIMDEVSKTFMYNLPYYRFLQYDTVDHRRFADKSVAVFSCFTQFLEPELILLPIPDEGVLKPIENVSRVVKDELKCTTNVNHKSDKRQIHYYW